MSLISASLISLTSREVVGSLLSTSILCGWKISVSTEVSVKNAVLEAGRILKINVELAILSLIGDGSAGSAGCNHGVENQSESKLRQYWRFLNLF